LIEGGRVSDHVLDQRKKGLEESFFVKHNRELLEAMRRKTDAAERRRQLIEVSGIKNEALLDELVGLGLDAGGLAALSLVPLLKVAWADGKVQPREREALLEAAGKAGVAPKSPAHDLLVGWLDREPEGRLFQAWKDYVRALRGAVSDDSVLALRTEVLARAKAVARAAGGILGVGSTLGSEQDVLDELEAAFDRKS
jgi:hypothetical protein